MPITTAFPNSAKTEYPQALHNFTQGSGHLFKAALAVASPAGNLGGGTSNYSSLGADELANGNGYTTGGFAWTAAQNITPALFGTEADWSWTVNPQWTNSTFSTSGFIIYNTSSGNRCVYVGAFTGVQTVNNSTFTITLPANGAGTAILGLT